VRLVCFPFAGGGASIFRSWSDELLPEIDVWSVELPGRETRFRERRPTALETVLDPIVEHLVASSNLPTALFGHSLGAVIAFEVARALCEHGSFPCRLFASAAYAPDALRQARPIHELPDAELIEKLRQYRGTPREVLEHRGLMELLLPLLRSDFRMAERYQYRAAPPLPCPITAIGGAADEYVTPDELDGWSRHTTAGFTRHILAGGHFFLATGERDLLQLISRSLFPY
jgi:medium-chain acyl-[acyl-carrier-protein] hydrolase